MKQNMKRIISFLLVLACALGLLPLSAFADSGLTDTPSAIMQVNADYLRVDGRMVRYYTANAVLLPCGHLGQRSQWPNMEL